MCSISGLFLPAPAQRAKKHATEGAGHRRANAGGSVDPFGRVRQHDSAALPWSSTHGQENLFHEDDPSFKSQQVRYHGTKSAGRWRRSDATGPNVGATFVPYAWS